MATSPHNCLKTHTIHIPTTLNKLHFDVWPSPPNHEKYSVITSNHNNTQNEYANTAEPPLKMQHPALQLPPLSPQHSALVCFLTSPYEDTINRKIPYLAIVTARYTYLVNPEVENLSGSTCTDEPLEPCRLVAPQCVGLLHYLAKYVFGGRRGGPPHLQGKKGVAGEWYKATAHGRAHAPSSNHAAADTCRHDSPAAGSAPQSPRRGGWTRTWYAP